VVPCVLKDHITLIFKGKQPRKNALDRRSEATHGLPVIFVMLVYYLNDPALVLLLQTFPRRCESAAVLM